MKSLTGLHLLITSGPTRSYLDAVRYICNKSTGKLGTVLALEALKRGALVTFVYGTDSKIPDVSLLEEDCRKRLILLEIETIDDLIREIHGTLKGNSFDAILHAMAVLDYAPGKYTRGKIPSTKETLVVHFEKTPKVIRQLRVIWPQAFFVGFKLEVGLSKDELRKRAFDSLKENNTDLVVANNQEDIINENHMAYFINYQGKIIASCFNKQEIAYRLMDIISLQVQGH